MDAGLPASGNLVLHATTTVAKSPSGMAKIAQAIGLRFFEFAINAVMIMQMSQTPMNNITAPVFSFGQRPKCSNQPGRHAEGLAIHPT
jgi:hypothetical protein